MTKYYKQTGTDGRLIAYGKVDGGGVPDGVEEISEADYTSGMEALAKADADAKAARDAKAKADAEAAEKAWQERQNTINDYVDKVKAGTVKLDDVPEEYRAEVDSIVNPPVAPPTNAELDKRLEASESAIDFLMTAVGSTAE